MKEDEFIFGTRSGWGGEEDCGINPEDARHHCYIIGKTGSGKTTLLRNLILQRIGRGHGIALLDPHGDLAEEILKSIPPNRAHQVVYFNPTDIDFPVGLNLLADVPEDERPLVASGIVDAFRTIWRDSWGPRMEYILYNAIAALLDCPNTSLLGINRMLSDSAYRQWVVKQVRDPFIREFWESEFESYDQRFMREAIAPIQNKVGQFLQSPIVRNILGQVRNRVSIPFVMDQSRIFIANLSKGKMGNDKANLLGSLLVSQFQLAAMGRARLPEEERRDFALFIDEFQNYSTDAFASILSEARKYRLSITLSHQYVDQLSIPVRQAVFGNVGSMICFRVGNTDGEVLAGEFGAEYSSSQFVDLAKFEILAKLYRGGVQQAPIRIRTRIEIVKHSADGWRLVDLCRARFSTPREHVESKITRWIARNF